MARLRFPGRPGLRFDRLGVRYGSADEANRRLDPSTQLIANIHKGLRCFREYFGESDEDDFDGFSKNDVFQTETKLTKLKNEVDVLEKEVLRRKKAPVPPPVFTKSGNILSGPTVPVPRESQNVKVPTVQKTTAKANAKETVKKLVEEGVAKQAPKKPLASLFRLKGNKSAPTSTQKKEKIALERKEGKVVKPPKLKAIKIRIGAGGKDAKIVHEGGRKKEHGDGETKRKEDHSTTDADKKKKEMPNKAEKTNETDISDGDDMLYSLGPDGDADDEDDDNDEDDENILYSLMPEPEPSLTKTKTKEKAKKVVVKPQTKKMTKAQQILAQVKKKKKLEEQKKVKKKEKEETKKVKKKEVAEKDNEEIETVEVKIEKPAGPKKDSTPSKQKPAPRQFVLPKMSSRSSRKITPVRFFDEKFPSGGSLTHRPKVSSPIPMQPIENTPPPVPAESSSITTTATAEVTTTIATTSVASPAVTTPTTATLAPTPVTTPSITTPADVEPKQPKLFEAPLVVTGKRPRKPSHKLIEKLADEDIQKRPTPKAKVESKKEQAEKENEQIEIYGNLPLGGPAALAGLIDKDEKEKKKVSKQRSELQSTDRQAGATKRSGQNILRKAKLQLNKAALSRVSRAVARSLKIKMRREERIMKEKQTVSLKQQTLQQQQQQQSQPKKPVYQFQPLDSTPPQQQAGGKITPQFGCAAALAAPLSPLKFESAPVFNLGATNVPPLTESTSKVKEAPPGKEKLAEVLKKKGLKKINTKKELLAAAKLSEKRKKFRAQFGTGGDKLQFPVEASEKTKQSKKRRTCEYCSHDFADKSALNRHVRKQHPDEKSALQCSQCDRSFKNEHALKIHTHVVHDRPRSKTGTAKDIEGQGTSEKMTSEVHEGEISLHQCSQCDRSFKQERALRIHRNVVHTNPRWKHMKHTNPSSTHLTLTKRKKRRKTKAAKDSEGQETSEEITNRCHFCQQEWTKSQQNKNRFYFDVPTCEACKLWYKKRCMDELAGTVLKCDKGGNCDVTDKKCSACRYKFIGSLLPPPSTFYEKISQEEAQSPSGETKVSGAEKSGASKVPVAEKIEEKKQKEDPKDAKQKVSEEKRKPLVEQMEEKKKEADKEQVVVGELITSNGGKSRISAPLQSMLTRHTEPHTSAHTPQKYQYQYPVTTYWGLKSTTSTPPAAGPDPIFKTPQCPKVLPVHKDGTNSVQGGAPNDPKVMPGVTIKVTNADGEESQVDVEAVDPRPLTPLPSPGSTPTSSPVKTPFGSPTRLDGDSFPELPPFPGSPESISSVTESPVSGQRGPRIKHVCRKAAVVLGPPIATFPTTPEFRLSALPSTEKERLLEDRSESEDSDDMSIDEIIRQARVDYDDPNFSPSKEFSPGTVRQLAPGPKAAKSVLIPAKEGTKHAVIYKRKMRCKKCKNCLVPDCRKCAACKDMVRYGGSGRLKKSCYERPECANLLLPGLYIKKAVEGSKKGETVLVRKKGLPKRKDSDDDSDDENEKKTTPKKLKSPPTEVAATKGTEVLSEKSQNGQKSETASSIPAGREGMRSSTRNQETTVNMSQSSQQHSYSESRHQLTRIPTRLPQNMDHSKKDRHKAKKEIKLSRGVATNTLPATRYKWPSEPQNRVQFVKADYLEDYDIDEAWRRGVAIVSSTPTCLRTICFLCASHGGHDMVYCSVCCEPFHKFCLEDTERPLKNDKENWCCPRCHFCSVCGKQNNLLQCDKCHDTYHPGCLGPYYPTKPSKGRGIWICTKCVKCKSCGATTPGAAYNATWTHDFSLCYECGMLMDKGNYCPICHSTYADDDWDCKMIQCSTCNSWVHAKCEGLTDDMYQTFSYLPEDIAYHCRLCYPMRPAPWETIIKEEMQTGFTTVIGNMLATKLAANLTRIEDEEPKGGIKKSKTREQVKAVLFAGPEPQAPTQTSQAQAGQSHSSQSDQTGPNLQQGVETQRENPKQIGDNLESYLTEQCGEGTSSNQETLDRSENLLQGSQTNETLQEPMQIDSHDIMKQSENTSPESEGSVRSSSATDTASEMGIELWSSGNSSTLVSPDPEPAGMETGQPTGDSGEGGSTSIAEELLRAIMENPQSTPDKETQRAMEGLLQGLKPEAKVTFSEGVKAISKVKTKSYPRDLKEVRRMVQEHRYQDISKFTDDIARVLQYNKSDLMPYPRKKACGAIQLIFLKEMQKYFPWVNVKASVYWSGVKLPDGMLPGAVVPPSEDHSYAQYRYRDDGPSDQPSPFKKLNMTPKKPSEIEEEEVGDSAVDAATGDDLRKCLFCQNFGDDNPDDCGRLLYAGQDDWVHVNCALWSAEVYEEVDGTLQNVHAAVVRGKQLRCNYCERSGATVGCCATLCHANFHYMCAREDGAVFQEDKTVYCKLHTNCITKPLMEDKFAVERRACIDQENNKWIKSKWSKGLNAETVNVIAGSMTVERLGKLTALSDRKGVLIPVGFTCTRVYWSTNDARRRTVYTCRVIEVHPSECNETQITMKDTTIIHDKTHPDYNEQAEIQLRQLSVSIGSSGHQEKDAALFSPLSDTSYAAVFSSEDESCFLSPKRRHDDPGYYSPYPTKKAKVVSESDVDKQRKIFKDIDNTTQHRSKSEERMAKFLALQNDIQSSQSSATVYDRLDLHVNEKQAQSRFLPRMSNSCSWPDRSNRQSAPQQKVNFSCLSTNTLKLLKSADLSKYTCSEQSTASGQVPAVDDLPLTQIANRLNSAAARNKPERSPSVERTTPTPSASSQDSVAAASVPRAVTPGAAVSVPVTVAAPITTATNVLLRQDAPTAMPFSSVAVTPASMTMADMPGPHDLTIAKALTPIAAIPAAVETVTNVPVPQDMTIARSFTPVAAIPTPVGTITNVPGARDMTTARSFTPIAAIPAPVGTVTNVPVPQDITIARPFTSVAAISTPVGTVTSVPVPQHMTTAMSFAPVVAIPAPVTNVAGPQDMTIARSFTPITAVPTPVAAVTNMPVPQDMTTGIRVTPLMSTIQVPVNVTPIQTMVTNATAASVENVTGTTQTMMATATSSKNPQSESELVEAEIIDESTGEKVVMMLSPGQVTQLRAGTMEVLPQDTELRTGDHQSIHSTSGQVYEQFQETPKGRSMEPVKEVRQTQAVRDKDGTVIGVQVSPRNPCNATTRRPLLPRKPSVGALPAVPLPVSALPAVALPVGAFPAVTLPVHGVNSVNPSTEASTSSQAGVPPEVMRMNVSGLPVEHASEESESETLMFCDGANDEKPKKKMRLSGPACAQLRRSSRSTPARDSENSSPIMYFDGTDDERKGDEETKSYGLRNTASRAASLAERRNSMPEVSVSLKLLSPESVRRLSQGIKDGSSGDISSEGDVPLHSKIAAKIKAESLARSSVGGSVRLRSRSKNLASSASCNVPESSSKGPIKCPKCKRLYRTKESCDKHAATCTFEVSDSDEEDEENSGDEPSPRALRRLRQSQSNTLEKGRVTRSTAAESSVPSPARPKRFTRSSAPSPTRSDEQLPHKDPSEKSAKSGSAVSDEGNQKDDGEPEGRYPRRKSAIMCERLTKDYAEEYGPDEMNDSGQNFAITTEDDVKSISSVEVEEIEAPDDKKDDDSKPLEENSDKSIQQESAEAKENIVSEKSQLKVEEKTPKDVPESDDDCMIVDVEPPEPVSPPKTKQKRVKIVSVGPDGQCHELAKAHIPQGKIADVMKALKSAHMSKVDSSDKLQELAETILEKTKKDGEVKLEDESVDPLEVIKKATISVSVVPNQPPVTATATVMPVQESVDKCIKVESSVTPQQPVPATTLVTTATTVVTTSSSGSKEVPASTAHVTRTLPRIIKSPAVVLNKVPATTSNAKVADLLAKSGPLKMQTTQKNIPVQKVSPRVVSVSPQQKLTQGIPPARPQSVPQVSQNLQPIQPQGVQPIQPNVAGLAQSVPPQISSSGFQVVPGVSVVSSGIGFPGGATVVYSGGQIVPQQPQVVVQQILQGPVVQHQHILMPGMQTVQPQIQQTNVQQQQTNIQCQLSQLNQSQMVLQGSSGTINVLGQTPSGQVILQDASSTSQMGNQPILPATARTVPPTPQILTIDPATQQLVQTRVQPSQPVVQTQPQQLMTVDQAGNIVAVQSPNIGMVASNAGVQGIAGLMPGVQVLSGSGQVLQQVGNLQPQPAPSPIVQQGTVVPQLQSQTPAPAATPTLQQPQPQQKPQQQQQQFMSNQQGQVIQQTVSQPVSRAHVGLFDQLSASELMKSMVQGRNTTCTVTTSSSIIASQSHLHLESAQGQTPRDRPNFFERAEQFFHPQKVELTPQQPNLDLSSIKIISQSPLAKAALESTPVVQLQRLKPIMTSPLKFNDIGSTNIGTINVQKLSNQNQPAQSNVQLGNNQTTPFAAPNVPFIPSAPPTGLPQRKSLTERDLQEQLLVGSPKKGHILRPVVKKLTHSEMMQLLTSKVDTPPMSTGPTMSASKLMRAIPGATMVTPSISTPVTTTVTSLNNAPRTASSERGDSKFLSREQQLSVIEQRKKFLVKQQQAADAVKQKYMAKAASLPQLSVKLDNIIKTQMGQKYLKYESKTAGNSSSSGQPDLPVPGFISKQVHKEPERRPGPGRPPKLAGNKNFCSQSSYRSLRSTLDSKLNRVQSQEMIRMQRLLEREKKRLRKQRMNFVKKRDDEQFPGTPHTRATLVTSHRQPVPVPAYEEEIEETGEEFTLEDLEREEARRRERLHGRRESPYLMFEITSEDGFHVRSESWEEAWKAVTDKVQDARANARLKQMSYAGVNGLSMFGLSHDAVVYLIEQLYGARNCRNYKFLFNDYEPVELEEEPEENPTGAARSEPFENPKLEHDMFGFLLSRYRPNPKTLLERSEKEEETLYNKRRATSMELPMAMRFRHLKLHAKEACGVFRSEIHGRGLFCKRDIDAGEMIIEYAGEVIRAALCDKREKYYEGKGIGCYMFRIDDNDVVDATLSGNAARFINHSCEPNCYSKIITVDNKKHIVIFALRAIKRGEELTYDYKFPIEEVKIPCTCGARKCRKYLN